MLHFFFRSRTGHEKVKSVSIRMASMYNKSDQQQSRNPPTYTDIYYTYFTPSFSKENDATSMISQKWPRVRVVQASVTSPYDSLKRS